MDECKSCEITKQMFFSVYNVFIFENKSRTGYEINIAKSNYLVGPFRMVCLINQRLASQTSTRECFKKTNNDYRPLTIFTKIASILYVFTWF